MTKVSAVVSAYFAEKFIEQRLKNLLEQTGVDLEIIVVCQEGSPEQAEALRAGVKVVATPDIPTVYAAWNLGIQNAAGEYITNANSDDRLYPGALAKLAEALDNHPRYAVAYGNQDIFEKGQLSGRFEWHEGGLDELVNQGCFMGPMPMWRKSLHDRYGLFDDTFTSAGDYEFWMRIAEKGEKFWHVKEVIGAYDKRGESVERRRKLLTLWETANARARHRGSLPDWIRPIGG